MKHSAYSKFTMYSPIHTVLGARLKTLVTEASITLSGGSGGRGTGGLQRAEGSWPEGWLHVCLLCETSPICMLMTCAIWGI